MTSTSSRSSHCHESHAGNQEAGEGPSEADENLTRRKAIIPAEEDPEEDFFDPWLPLDPNNPGTWQQKPYRKMGKPRPRKPHRTRLKAAWLFGAIPPAPANPRDLAFREFLYALPSKDRKPMPAKSLHVRIQEPLPPLQSAFSLDEVCQGGLPVEDVDDYAGVAPTTQFLDRILFPVNLYFVPQTLYLSC
jgi:hypothetical protein